MLVVAPPVGAGEGVDVGMVGAVGVGVSPVIVVGVGVVVEDSVAVGVEVGPVAVGVVGVDDLSLTSSAARDDCMSA